MSKKTDIISKIARDITAGLKLKLVNVEYVKEGENWILRVFIDNENGELKIDHCEQVSKLLSDELDKNNPIENKYILEVSSPGLERSLKTSSDYENFAGEKIIINTYAPIDGKKEFMGKLLGLKDDIVSINLGGPKGVVKIPLSKIANANLTIDF